MKNSTMSLMLDPDFSLFGGELLFPPPAVSDEVVTKSQDGLGTIQLKTAHEKLQSVESLSPDVLSNTAVSGNPFEEWLDTPVDLLDLFSGDKFSIPEATLPAVIQLEDPKTELSTLEGLKTLTDLAEELSTGAQTATAPQITVKDNELSGQVTKDVYDTGLGLLELFTGEVNAENDESAQIADPGLVSIDIPSMPILSPMSPEDVETILSSGPASPESCIAEVSFDSIASTDVSLDTSLIDYSLEPESCLSEDLIELSRMVQPNGSLEELMDITEVTEVHVNKSRPTPYERKKAHRDNDDNDTTYVGIPDRKQRKKQQNKDAATRYRMKKKKEQEIFDQELELLENRNSELKDKVSQMTKEIQYLKNLLTEVHKAKIQRVKSK